MNFKDLQAKILLENFVKYCKKNSITEKDIKNVEVTWNEQYYLKEFIGDLIRKGTEKIASFGYQRGLNAISAKVQKLMDELNKSSTDVNDIIQTYKIDTNDNNIKGILQALQDLKTPYTNLQAKLTTLAGTTSKGLRGGPVEAEKEEEIANQPLIDSIAKEIQTQFDTSFPVGGTPQAEQNRKLLSTVVQKYFKALNPEQFETAKKNIVGQIQKSAGNDAKVYAVLININKLAGGTGDVAKDFGREKEAKIRPADINRWMSGITNYFNTLTTIDQKVKNNFLNAYKDLLKKADAAAVGEINKTISRKVKDIIAEHDPKKKDNQKEMELTAFAAKMKTYKVTA